VIQEVSRHNAAVAGELTRLADDFKYEQVSTLIQTAQEKEQK
jgi:hypothetical protein